MLSNEAEYFLERAITEREMARLRNIRMRSQPTKKWLSNMTR